LLQLMKHDALLSRAEVQVPNTPLGGLALASHEVRIWSTGSFLFVGVVGVGVGFVTEPTSVSLNDKKSA
jgi:hypothetical protein